VTENDPEAARRWLEEQAEQGERGEQAAICPLTQTTSCAGADATQCPAC
jgi:hypothetical protein